MTASTTRAIATTMFQCCGRRDCGDGDAAGQGACVRDDVVRVAFADGWRGRMRAGPDWHPLKEDELVPNHWTRMCVRGNVAEPPNRVRFRYSFADGYRLVPANGALGGLTPKGDFRVEFYVEAQSLPEFQDFALTEGKKLGEQLDPPEVPVVDRRVTAGVVLSLAEAERLGVWLLERTSEARKKAEKPQ